jgi:hypothetical protein
MSLKQLIEIAKTLDTDNEIICVMSKKDILQVKTDLIDVVNDENTSLSDEGKKRLFELSGSLAAKLNAFSFSVGKFSFHVIPIENGIQETNS